MLEFNPDGSLKLSAVQLKDQEMEKISVVITREQISDKPAKAQLRIKFPEDVQSPNEILHFYSIIDDSQFDSVEHSISQIDSRTFIIKVDKGDMLMYSLLNFMVDCFKMKFEQDIRFKRSVVVKGIWGNFGKGYFS